MQESIDVRDPPFPLSTITFNWDGLPTPLPASSIENYSNAGVTSKTLLQVLVHCRLTTRNDKQMLPHSLKVLILPEETAERTRSALRLTLKLRALRHQALGPRASPHIVCAPRAGTNDVPGIRPDIETSANTKSHRTRKSTREARLASIHPKRRHEWWSKMSVPRPVETSRVSP
jgi:hypothetical protein